MKPKKESLPLVNDKITAPQVQLILYDGTNRGVVSRFEALSSAEEMDLDLVMIAEQGSEGVPVVKLMDFGRASYEKKKKQAESKKHQKVIQVKEIKIRPKIGEHDFKTKMKKTAEFLQDGKRVKITLWFKGRENAMKDQHGMSLFERVEKSFDDYGFTKDLTSEKDTKIGQIWSRTYYLKSVK